MIRKYVNYQVARGRMDDIPAKSRVVTGSAIYWRKWNGPRRRGPLARLLWDWARIHAKRV